jgi:branched chain amino acid efflux pump
MTVDARDGSGMAERVTFTLSGARLGAQRTLPIVPSAWAFGIVVGVLARQAGLSFIEAVLMSGLVFAGAAQFIALGLWATPLPALSIVVTTLIVNLRHLMMGAALRPWFSSLPAPKAYGSVFFMTDETWALMMREHAAGMRDAAFMVGSGLVLFVSWVGATATGMLIGATLQEAELAAWGLDFVFTAVFLALLVGLWKGRSDILPWAAAAGVALATYLLLPGTNWYILAGGLAGSIAGAWWERRSEREG